MDALAKTTRTDQILGTLRLGKKFTLDAVLDLHRAALAERVDATVLRPQLDEIMERSVHEQHLATLYAEAQAKIEETTAALRWAQQLAESEIFRRLVARAEVQPELHVEDEEERKPLSMPHPLLDIKLEPQYGSYTPDVDVIETILPRLKPEERDKALTIVPERKVKREVIPAHTVPRQLIIGATGSLKAIRDRYKGSDVGAILERELRRDFRGWKLTIKPAKAATKNVTGSAKKALS